MSTRAGPVSLTFERLWLLAAAWLAATSIGSGGAGATAEAGAEVAGGGSAGIEIAVEAAGDEAGGTSETETTAPATRTSGAMGLGV
jgi:hypothetical protein